MSRIDPNEKQDIQKNAYFKQLQDQLKAKRDAKSKQQQHLQQAEQVSQQQEVSKHHETQVQQEKTVDFQEEVEQLFKDDVSLSAFEQIENEEGEAEDSDQKQQQQEFEDDLKTDGRKILRYLAQKIDFKAKIPELKEMYRETTLQSRSHNEFMARFGRFKVGVVGQILSMVGVHPKEIQALKNQAIEQAFEENLEMMAENIYNTELAEMVYGNSKRNQNSLKLFGEVANQLIEKMRRLGRTGYWSKTRLIEEKLTQTKRIRQEFIEERQSVKYQRGLIAQQGVK